MIDIIHAYVSQFVACTREDCEKTLESWTLTPIEVGGIVVGAVMERGNEIHVTVTPEAHRIWAKRGLAQKHLVAGIEKYGFMVTTVRPENKRFVERLGFYPVGTIGPFIKYRIDHAQIQ